MTDTITSKNIDFSSWNILYTAGLLIFSEKHAADLHPETNESSPHLHILS
jgi:hypothetical protein